MNRRQLLALSPALFMPSCRTDESASSPKKTEPSPPIVGKKGLCLSARQRAPEKIQRFLRAVEADWLYNWDIEAPAGHAAEIAFTPMIYRVSPVLDERLAKLQSLTVSRGYRELLGYNEPDSESQGNTSVEAALEAWPKLEATGLRLGSPATVHPDNEWMLAFMKGVEKRGLRVDFICMHSYGGPGVESMIRKIEKVHDLFKRPIWITEFAVADWEAKSAGENRFPAERVADYVRELLPRIEAMDIVERYAWFHGGVSGGPLASSKLFHPDGSLTLVGEAYRDAH
ncbi:MAG: glycoside hydrolase family protein [Akkermansiaceae bacterium]|jgi:hypothetical protein|nr:glycoside hydrolase family protein [Akkermansiaceae bacterium]